MKYYIGKNKTYLVGFTQKKDWMDLGNRLRQNLYSLELLILHLLLFECCKPDLRTPVLPFQALNPVLFSLQKIPIETAFRLFSIQKPVLVGPAVFEHAESKIPCSNNRPIVSVGLVSVLVFMLPPDNLS